MTERDRDAERLPEDAARRLLARASELEAARGTELSVAELREAAREAGIAPGAFEQALAELRERGVAASKTALPTQAPRRPRLRYFLTALIISLLVVFFLARVFPGT